MRSRRLGPRTLLIVAAAIAAALPPLAGVRGEESRADLANRFILGYDSFIDRFTILEIDTADTVHDFYAGIANALTLSRGASRLGLSNNFRYGNQSIDDLADVDGSFAPLAALVLDARGGLRLKHYQDESDYEFGNDYAQGNALLRARARLGRGVRIGARGRIEIVDYRERTLYDYDYRYHDFGMEIEAESGPANGVFLSASSGFREVPDTTELSFDRFLGDVDARLGSGSFSLRIGSLADRRDFRENVRSDYWNMASIIEGTFVDAGRRAYSLRGEAEIVTVDRPDTIYFDTYFLRGGLRGRFPVREALSLYAEPRYGRMLCPDFAEERYEEITVVLGFDAFGGARYWIGASYEPGVRDYENDENLLYSDFTLHRISIMGSVTIATAYSINLLLNHEPEYHSRREDDFSITLVSVDMTMRF